MRNLKFFAVGMLCAAGLIIQFGRVTTAQAPALAPMVVSDPLQRQALAEATKDLDLAQARYDNIVLRLRLAMKVPNQYGWRRDLNAFVPPPEPNPSPAGTVSPSATPTPKLPKSE